MLPSNPQSSRAGFTRNLLHLYTLSAFGIAQPLFDRLSGHVTYLLDRGITRGSVVLLALVLVLVVPTLLAITQVLVRLVRPQWQRRVQSGLMGLLLVIIACPFARHLVEHQPIIQWGLAGYLAVAIALSAGVLLTMAYHRTTWLSRWISWASPAIALFPLYFLLVGPAMTAVFPRRLERRTVRSRRPVPVVMVVFDAFCGMSLLNEEHRIDPIRYPHLAHLAASATWYRNATTVHSRTPAAVPAILTGAMPHGVNRPPTEAEYPQNLFRVLQDSGQYDFLIYECLARLASPELNRESASSTRTPVARVAKVLPTLWAVYLRTILPPDIPVARPPVPPEWYGLTSDFGLRPVHSKGAFRNPWLGERDRQFQQFLAGLDRPTKPTLSFIHLCIPHSPWCYLPSGRQYREDRFAMDSPLGGFGPDGEDWTDDQLVVEHSWQRYLLQVQYADRLVGQLQERLEELGLFDDCLLIVTADHGVSFLPGHSRRTPDGANLSEILSVPLLIKYPHQQSGVVDDRNVESIDMLPTIADMVDLELPFSVDGNSLLGQSAAPRARKTLVRGDGELIVVDPRFPSKYDSVDRLIATFGTGTRDDRLWRAGPLPELIGRRIDELPVSHDEGVPVEVLHEFGMESTQTDGLVPCCVHGRVVQFDHDAMPVTIAVVVNGVIAGVTRTSLDARLSDQFAVMLPESAFAGAADKLQLFEVRSVGGRPELAPCGSPGGTGGE